MKRNTLFWMISIAVFVGILIIPQRASAVAFTLFQSDLLNLVDIDDSPSGCCSLTGPAAVGIGVEIGPSHIKGTDPDTTQRIGLSGGTLPTTDLTGFDTYELIIQNTNDDGWQWRLWVVSGSAAVPDLKLGSAKEKTGTFTLIKPDPDGAGPLVGETKTLVLDITSSVTLNDIEGIGIDIYIPAYGVSDPLTGCTESALCQGEAFIKPIPEPATALLLGSGLLGLVGVGYRRKRRLA